MFNISLPAPARPATVFDATAILMRRARSAADFHGCKVLPNLTRDQKIYTEILIFPEEQGLDRALDHLESAREIMKDLRTTF